MIDHRNQLATTPERELALTCLERGIKAADPQLVIFEKVHVSGSTLTVMGDAIDLGAFERILVVGGGKASGRQVTALEELLDDQIDDGLVVTTEQIETSHVRIREGDHPVPSARGVEATKELISLVEDADAETLVLVVITGGGSALLPAPAPGISLDDLRVVTEALLASGATIHEMNAVRKHLSTSKGGQLASAAAPATVVSLLMSDVVGDDPSVIASGPTVPDETTFADATSIIEHYEIDVPKQVADRLARGVTGEIAETPGPNDRVFERVSNYLLADSGTAIRAAEKFAAERGINTLRLSASIRGEAREAAKTHVAIGEEMQTSGHPIEPPAILLSAGETTVTITGDGEGGPNQEFTLSAAIEAGVAMTVAAIDTDGIDGASPAAGAIIDENTVENREHAREELSSNNAYPYLSDKRATIVTGPTGTNVNDFRVLVVGEFD